MFLRITMDLEEKADLYTGGRIRWSPADAFLGVDKCNVVRITHFHIQALKVLLLELRNFSMLTWLKYNNVGNANANREP